MYNLDELNEFFKNDIFATKLLNAKILEANNDYAKCFFEITADHKNAKGVVMGGAIFSLADFTFAVATNQHEEYYTVSTTSNINFIRPAFNGKLTAEAIKIKDGKTICFYEISVYDDTNILIAKVNMTGTHVVKEK